MPNALAQIGRQFAGDPVSYANIVLGVTLTEAQERILRLLVTPPYKCLVPAAHNVGKTFLAALAALWWYDCHDPSICLVTAPTDRQVRSILFKEMRSLRGVWGGWIGPKAPHLQDSSLHFVHGFTASDDAHFQGHHGAAVMVIFDEAVGVDPLMWEAMETMLGGSRYCFLGIYNPTDQSSYAYTAERSGRYHVVSLSALSHPNIDAELAGRPAPFPNAIRLARLDELIRQWSTPVPASDRQPGDIEWPPRSGSLWRPSPVCEARLLGRWPTLAANSIWAEALWEAAAALDLPEDGPLQIGCDPARFGDDDTAIHVRKGGVSLHHEAHNGYSTSQTAARLKALAEQYGRRYNLDPTQVPVAVDDTGVGGGVSDQRGDYAFVAINSSSKAFGLDYPNKRSELWFDVADRAARGEVSFKRLPEHVKADLRRELLAPLYTIDAQGRRVVERKDLTKKRIGRSPDTADAVLLAHAALNTPRVTTFIGNPSAVPPPPQGPVFGWPGQSLVAGRT